MVKTRTAWRSTMKPTLRSSANSSGREYLIMHFPSPNVRESCQASRKPLKSTLHDGLESYGTDCGPLRERSKYKGADLCRV